MNAYDRENIGYLLTNPDGQATWFTAQLLRLIAHSDLPHRMLLRRVFPEEVAAYETWLITHEPLETAKSHVASLVDAAHDAVQYVVAWHVAGNAAKNALIIALEPFEV